MLSRLPHPLWMDRLSYYPTRFRTAFSYYRAPLRNIFSWLVSSSENTNFTYDLTPLNLSYLANTLSLVTGSSVTEISGYLEEILNDEALKTHIREAVLHSDQGLLADPQARYGRRVGWYALARALKPKVVVETGVDKGLGTCVLAAAVRRNALEGHPGRVYGTEINPAAGYLLGGVYAEHGEILYGDSIESLVSLTGPIDLFVNDSDHSADYERREYETIAGKLSPRAVIVGDNAHVTPALRDFALKTGRAFLFFQEKPDAHWYPGGGIGLAFTPKG